MAAPAPPAFIYFPRSKELNKELTRTPNAGIGPGTIRRAHPAPAPGAPARHVLPGQPKVNLDNNQADLAGDFLSKEFSTEGLRHIWFRLMTTPSYKSIDPLTHQIVRGREIVITEQLRLHLIWGYGQIFIKPIPRYLLSHAFWEHYLQPNISPLNETQRVRIRKYALGFMRTYCFLIQHESDLRIAQDEKFRLVPEGIDWEDFHDFISGFSSLDRTEPVPNRFGYGQISLFRLNIWYDVFHPFAYKGFQSIERKWGYRAQFFLFAFATASVITGAMQTAASVQTLVPTRNWPHISTLWITTQGFSVACIIFFTAIACIALTLQILKLIRQALYSLWQLIFK